MTPHLTNIFFECWSKLGATGSKDLALPNMTVCNYAADDINAYTVVLREVNAQTYNLIFYTDHRSPKVKQLRMNAKVTVVIYNDNEKLQLILKGEAIVHYENEMSQQYWQKSGYKGRRSYLAKPGPSTVIDEPTDGLTDVEHKTFEEHDPAGYENFAAVTIKISSLEYLKLSRKGNRRAKFTLGSDSEWTGFWLIP